MVAMIIRLANVLYWLAAAVSAVLVALIGVSVVFGDGEGLALPSQIIIGIVAVLIWLAGRAVLYVFADR